MKWTILPKRRTRAGMREWCWIIIGSFTTLLRPRVLADMTFGSPETLLSIRICSMRVLGRLSLVLGR